VVAGRAAVPAGSLAQSAGQVGLSCAGGSQHQDVQVATDPLPMGKLQNEAALQPASGGEVEVFEERLGLPRDQLEAAPSNSWCLSGTGQDLALRPGRAIVPRPNLLLALR